MGEHGKTKKFRSTASANWFSLGLMLALLWGGFASGAAYVTRARTPADDNAPGQPADEVAAAQLVLHTLRADERLVLEPPRDSIDGLSLGKYSAIAERVVPTPATDDLAALRASGAGYRRFRGLPQRSRTIAHERVGRDAAETGQVLQAEHPGFLRPDAGEPLPGKS